MKIMVITQPNSGVGYHRLMMPIQFMEKEYALFTDVISEELLQDGFDVLVINRFIHNTTLEHVLQAREKFGFKLIVDIDDYWILDPWHIIKTYPTQKILEHIKAADIVTCTNEKLLREIEPLNKNVYILPNALPFGRDQFTDVRTESDKVRFVWAGGITHEKDLELLRNPLKRIDPDLKAKTQFIIGGYKQTEVWNRMVHHFTCGLKLPCVVKPALEVGEYMNLYNDADCAIVPLVSSKFNAMKSNLKVLEAAAKKIPVITSNVEPYSECPFTIKVNSQKDWYLNIKKVTHDAIYRQEMGIANYEWCLDNHHLDKVNELRKQIYA